MKTKWILVALCIPIAALGATEVAKVRHVTGRATAYDSAVMWWKKISNAQNYDVQLRDSNGKQLTINSSNTNSTTLTNLTPSSTYYVKIRGKKGKRNGRWSIAKLVATPAKPAQKTTTIFGGDVMLSRYVGRVVTQSGDFSLPFTNIAAEFAQNDLAFINLEAPFKETGPYTVADSGMSFKVDPRMIDGLTLAGIDVASLENNHIYNAGQSGVDFSKQHLTNHDIRPCINEPTLVTVRDITFAFLCYSYDRTLQTDDLVNDVKNVYDKADIIIVSMHNGNEYTDVITSSQSNFAHTAIDHGADLVIGHHPHVVQRMEHYKDGYIFYSLGNLIFDQDWSWLTQLGAVIKCTWKNERLQKIEFKPIKIDKDFQPRFMNHAEGKEVLQRLRVDDFEMQIFE